MRYFKIVFFVLVIFFLHSCNEIPLEITEPVIPDSERVVLLEELTGVSCTNCPRGAIASDFILDKYPGRVIVVGIHGKLLSDPIKDKSKYDFRNEDAKNLELSFTDLLGKPAASINRVPNSFGSITDIVPDKWLGAVESELSKPHVLNILIETNYNVDSRVLNVDITAIPLVDLNDNYFISVYLTESGIIDAQYDGGTIIPDYTHNHVLMDMITAFDGDAFGSNLKKDQLYKKSFSHTLPVVEGLWQPERMEVIAMISHKSASDKSVLQAVSAHVKE
ncbi:MAG: Omp28-related outer membrane protein [Saprospiraceae bacterium]